MKKRPTPRASKKRLLAWLPAVLTLGAGLTAAVGISLVPSAVATTDSENITVSATVAPYVEAGNSCSGAVTAGSSLVVNSGEVVLGSCTITFGTNNASSGAVLSVSDQNNDGYFFCKTGARDCSTADVRFANIAAGTATLSAGTFGMRHAAAGDISGCTSTRSAGLWYPIINSGANICTQSTVGALPASQGSYTASFGAATSATQASGNYAGVAVFTATAS